MKLTPVKSSNILEAGYDGKSKARVRFKNGSLYENTKPIAPKEYAAFEATHQTKDSSGTYFHENMKKFDFKKVDE